MKIYTTVSLAALAVLIAVASGTTSATDNVSNGTIICNVVGTSYECANWSSEQYPAIDLFGDEYVSLFAKDDDIWEAHVNKLASLILDSNETHILKPGERIYLGHSYALEVKEIDIETEKAWLEFTRDGQHVADKNVSIDTDDNRTWIVSLDNVQGENDTVVMKVHVKQLFVGTETSIIWIDGIWLIDYANARTLNIRDEFGGFTLEEIISGVDASNPGSLIFKNASVADDLITSEFSASPTPEKGIVKFVDKSTGSFTPWYRNFWGWITMKSK